MKKLLFIGIVALMVQSLGAVTLPSTSYSPYSGASSTSDGSFTTSGGSVVTGSFLRLSSVGSEWGDQCTAGKEVSAQGLIECDNCCERLFDDDGGWTGGGDEDARTECLNECGRSLGNEAPLDGGLLILLVLSLAGGAVKLLRNRDKE